MEPEGNSNEEELQQIFESLRIFVQRIATKAAGDKDLSAGFINCLTNLVLMTTRAVIARDVIAFRNHAGRKTISEEDVLLIARKSPFYEHLAIYLQDELGVKLRKKGSRQKTLLE
ncbi:putative apoptosis-inducing TAF9-like domain 1 family protein [Histomonas meleagridis]|uniref:putative apoptosis-inducing TAF9-like domain 1 family protein n=1 Tax=Histomonas meleagridis TaxID=135588 RepID=UPI00355A2A5E|nr:putative apoptosis-inducing TAF9-like domain 1 family protein [Histomonas meleagridis]KAH0799678.1 putative apoptosis-inducing TAF9-like domain 1 family protein [Histomonas meleagridis]